MPWAGKMNSDALLPFLVIACSITSSAAFVGPIFAPNPLLLRGQVNPPHLRFAASTGCPQLSLLAPGRHSGGIFHGGPAQDTIARLAAGIGPRMQLKGGGRGGRGLAPLLTAGFAAALLPLVPPAAIARDAEVSHVETAATSHHPVPRASGTGEEGLGVGQSLWPREADGLAQGAGMLLADGDGAEKKKPEVDEEHKVLNEVLDLVDQHFFDLSNEKSVGDSASSHIYNSINWDQVRAEEASKPLKDRKSTYKEASKVLSRLGDKYTRFLPPEDFQKLTKYDSTGVGVLLVQREGGLYVASPPLKGSTADQEGVQKDDRFISIDGVDVRQGKSPFEGAELLSGKKGTTLKVEIERRGTRIPTVTLERKISVDNPVTSYVIGAKDGCRVGYMRVREFNGAVKRGVSTALRELRDEKVDSYVVDLRGNLGGVLEGSLEIAGLFVDEPRPDQKRTIVYVKDRSGKEEPIWAQPRLALDIETPVFVLVDRKSASASEVLAGALQANCRAVVVGKENSFGKGLIQGAFPMSDGSGTIITVAKYLTPKKGEIQGVGVIPDFNIKIGDARKAIKTGVLNLKDAKEQIAACVPPDYDDGVSQTEKRSGTDSTLEQLNGRTKSPTPKKDSLFRSGNANL